VTRPPAVSDTVLSPLSFLERSARVWATRPAVRDATRTWTYREHHERVRRLAAALSARLGVEGGDRVAVLLPNVAAMLELHYAVPAAGAVLVPLNTRLAAPEYAYILGHSGAGVVVAARDSEPRLAPALDELGGAAPRVVWVEADGGPDCEYEALLAEPPLDELPLPGTEGDLLSINYTSGTTGRPKGVMTSHRGAFLHSLGVVAEAGLSPESAYLWTLPMFHCNGWAYPWAVTAMGAKHVCLPRVEAGAIWSALQDEGITHLCGAPAVVNMMLAVPEASRLHRRVEFHIGGSPPSPHLLERAAALNLKVTHLYGLTETYGPIAVCARNPDWDRLPPDEQARLHARQGVGTVVSERIRVVDDELRDVPADGETMGEVVMRGANVMLGYYDDPQSTEEAFRGGWFHSGDLAVMHPDGYIQLRDRLKDIVVSGGENVSTIEVEHALTAHPSVVEAAVVGAPDAKWGEAVTAFVTLREPLGGGTDALRDFVRDRLAGFKVPKRIEVVDELPKTATGKVQKFRLREQVSAGA
jgi:fatty-acyl-CoA synthase